MKILLAAVAMLAAAEGVGPSVAEFNAALAAACPDFPVQTRNISCARPDSGSIQHSCRYELKGADGRWTAQTSILQLAEGEWVWIDGPTRCSDEAATDLN